MAQRAGSEVRAAGALAAPDLVDVETGAFPRKRWIDGSISNEPFVDAIHDLEAIDHPGVLGTSEIREARG